MSRPMSNATAATDGSRCPVSDTPGHLSSICPRRSRTRLDIERHASVCAGTADRRDPCNSRPNGYSTASRHGFLASSSLSSQTTNRHGCSDESPVVGRGLLRQASDPSAPEVRSGAKAPEAHLLTEVLQSSFRPSVGPGKARSRCLVTACSWGHAVAPRASAVRLHRLGGWPQRRLKSRLNWAGLA